MQTAKRHPSTPLTAGIALTLLSAVLVYSGVIYAWDCQQFQCIPTGRMTGGGWIMTTDNIKVTHGFILHCNANTHPNNLQINWEGNHFHLESWENVQCFDDPTISPNPPPAPFDRLEGNGHGRYNGVSEAFVFVQISDAGEPGRDDYLTIVIYDADGNLVIDVSGFLDGGDHQAHRSNK